MKASQQTIQQLERAIKKIAAKYPAGAEPVLTDIHLLVDQESGEVRAYNDEDEEINRCVVEQWIGNTDEDFYQQVAPVLHDILQQHHQVVEEMSLMRPFSFVLMDDDRETLQDLYYVDNGETVILDGDLLKNLDEDLDTFLKHLLSD